MEAIETFDHAGMGVKIYRDPDPQSPEDNGNTDMFLIANHRQFHVSRKGITCDGDTPKENKADYHVLPLIAYIHSGVALSLRHDGYPFNDHWDSGQVGWVLVRKRYGFRNIRNAAESLVQEWNSYLSGECYGYVVELPDGPDLDSCWGFAGDIKYCIAEAKRAAEACAQHEARENQRLAEVCAL